MARVKTSDQLADPFDAILGHVADRVTTQSRNDASEVP